jgi:predicted ATPase
MRALIDWSYNLLTAPERALFRALSAFEQEWTLDDVAKVSSNNRGIGGADVLDLLTQLVKKSLVLIDEGATPARYHMLKTVRQYAQERALEVGHER